MMKTLVMVLLFVVLIAAAVFQFMRMRPQPTETAPPPAPAQVQAEQAVPPAEVPTEEPALPPDAETVAPVPEGGEAAGAAPPKAPAAAGDMAATPPTGVKPAEAPPPEAAPAPPEQGTQPKPVSPVEPPAQEKRPERKKDLPKISFMDEAVDEQFRESRFFVVNNVVPSKNPFVPMQTFVPMRVLGGKPGQLGPEPGPGSIPGSIPAGVENGEMPLLPLPGETMGDVTPIKLIGVSTGSQSTTALFEVNGEVILAHPGWLVGSDYVFVGAQFGKANLLDRNTNRIIQLASGETL